MLIKFLSEHWLLFYGMIMYLIGYVYGVYNGKKSVT